MDERATQLAVALGLPTAPVARASTAKLFAVSDTIKAGELQLKQKKITASQTGSVIDIDVLDPNGKLVASARILECSSFDAARHALLLRLVLNSMGMESLIQKYELLAGEAGDFCIVEKTFDKTARKYTADPAMIHFVRGNTVVSLYSGEKDKDIRATAKVLDAVLSEVSGAEQSEGK